MATEVVLHTIEMAKPIMMGRLILIISDVEGPGLYDSETIYVLAMVIGLNILTRNGWMIRHFTLANWDKKIHTCIRSLLYSKLLRLQLGSCPSSISEGNILSLIHESHTPVGMIWRLGTLMFCTTTFFWGSIYLYNLFGSTFVITNSIMMVILFVLAKLRTRLEPIREEKDKLHEKQAQKLSEIFNNIKMLKLYGWQDMFHKSLIETREETMKL